MARLTGIVPERVRRLVAGTFVTLAALSLAACGRGGPGSPEPPAPWVAVGDEARLYSDNLSGIKDSTRIAIRDAAMFRDYWQRATSEQMSPPSPPNIDFSRDMVLVVAAGLRTPDDRIRVDSVVVRREVTTTGERDVFNAIVRVIQGCSQFNADAYPVEIVRVRRFDGPVQFVERQQRAAECRSP
jgi:hypothetical protein